jgi:hypothetical protein
VEEYDHLEHDCTIIIILMMSDKITRFIIIPSNILSHLMEVGSHRSYRDCPEVEGGEVDIVGVVVGSHLEKVEEGSLVEHNRLEKVEHNRLEKVEHNHLEKLEVGCIAVVEVDNPEVEDNRSYLEVVVVDN